MMKFDFIPLDDIFDELQAHVAINLKEIVAVAKEFDVDWNTYRSAAELGSMMVLTLRHDDKLVGYSVFYMSLNLRNKRMIEATNHGVFLEKEYRIKYGARMLSEADKFLKRVGVNETMYINDSKVFGRLLARNGYKQKTIVWSVKYGQ